MELVSRLSRQGRLFLLAAKLLLVGAVSAVERLMDSGDL
jgi:hypothetical protein